MLIFTDAVFLHVPKTGGTWVKAAVTNAGLHFEEHLVDGDIDGDLSHCPFRDRFVFAFVREPLSLYQAYWRFKIMVGWESSSDEALTTPRWLQYEELAGYDGAARKSRTGGSTNC